MTTQQTPAYAVVLRNAVGKDGLKADAFIGADFSFSTRRIEDAQHFDKYEAERFCNHWRGFYRGFAGGANVEVLKVTQ